MIRRPPRSTRTDTLFPYTTLIEAFLIRDTRNASMDKGINLLDSLALQFDGTLVNYSYDKESDEATGDVAVTLPGITYSLNLANRDLSHVSKIGRAHV